MAATSAAMTKIAPATRTKRHFPGASMSNILLTGPAAEPLTLAEAKNFLRVEHDADDDLITALIAAARIHAEAETHRALMTQTWRLVFDRWPRSGRIDVRPAPLRSLIAARVYDSGGVAHTVDPQAFVVNTASSTLAFAPWSPMQPGRVSAGIEIDVSVGFGDAGDVPEPLRQAVRLLVAHWYENRRISAGGGEAATLPATVAALTAPYRMVSL
jgi:uncharacterized phiE125 gp8 family phage protein